MNNDLDSVWKKTDVVEYYILFLHLDKFTKENYEILQSGYPVARPRFVRRTFRKNSLEHYFLTRLFGAWLY
jgi:hypothetical protein